MKPTSLAEYKGQTKAKAILLPAIEAAKKGKTLNHILLFGPAGTGKTTLAELIAKETGGTCMVIDARNIHAVQDFLDLAMKLRSGDILFIDEIHGLPKDVEELMYEALQSFVVRLKIGDRMFEIPLCHFTVVGATTKVSEISAPLRTRLKLQAQLELYTPEELAEMAVFKCKKIGRTIDKGAAWLLAKAARGTARVLEGNIERADDLATILDSTHITTGMAQQALQNMGVDQNGLNDLDRKIIRTIRDVYRNQPTGLKTLAATVGDTEDTLEEVVEPHLLREGILLRTPRGRVLSERGLVISA